MSTTPQKQVLIIEDNTICQEIYKVIFRRLNCLTFLVGTAAEAIGLVNQFRYDCILADWGLPDSEGDTLLKAIRATPLNKVTPLVVISAHISDDIRQACESLDIQGSYSKPLVPKEVEAIVSPYL